MHGKCAIKDLRQRPGVRMRIRMLLALISAFVVMANVYAYYNVTYINTTMVLNQNQSARVIEDFSVYVSNSSVSQYILDRAAGGLNISYWQNILYTHALTEHIVSRRQSIHNLVFLPGSLVQSDGGGTAVFTMSYYVNNVTTMKNIAPREFEYTLNNSVFNFEQTASGQALPQNTKLNIMIPSGAQVISIYPQPDAPRPNFIGNYTNTTKFSWYSGESLQKLTFEYATRETLEEEVLGYFRGVYKTYSDILYAIGIIALVLGIVYAYLRSEKAEITKKRK